MGFAKKKRGLNWFLLLSFALPIRGNTHIAHPKVYGPGPRDTGTHRIAWKSPGQNGDAWRRGAPVEAAPLPWS